MRRTVMRQRSILPRPIAVTIGGLLLNAGAHTVLAYTKSPLACVGRYPFAGPAYSEDTNLRHSNFGNACLNSPTDGFDTCLHSMSTVCQGATWREDAGDGAASHNIEAISGTLAARTQHTNFYTFGYADAAMCTNALKTFAHIAEQGAATSPNTTDIDDGGDADVLEGGGACHSHCLFGRRCERGTTFWHLPPWPPLTDSPVRTPSIVKSSRISEGELLHRGILRKYSTWWIDSAAQCRRDQV